MGIKIFKEDKVFIISNKNISYAFRVNDLGILEHMYFGKKVAKLPVIPHDPVNFQFNENGKFHNNPKYYDNFSLCEFGTYLRCDLRPASFKIEDKGDSLTDFRYVSYSKTKHVEYPVDYPHSKNTDNSTAITFKLKDYGRKIYLYITYRIFDDCDILSKSSKIVNKTGHKIILNKVTSNTLDMKFNNQQIVHFSGSHMNERHTVVEDINYGSKVLYSVSGRSDHYENPFFILKNKDTDNEKGEGISFNIFYSGNFKNDIHLSVYNDLRITTGINDECFAYTLNKGEEFLIPEAVIGYSNKGLNALSHQNHTFIQNHVVRKTVEEFPLFFNSWEGALMDFDTKSILEYIDVSKRLETELFVLDDGWFSTRNDDLHGLGDWSINHSKIDLNKVSNYVHSLGMKFGIWIEPECVNIDTPIYKEHPEYVLSNPRVEQRFMRNQLVLDFSNPKVVDIVYDDIYKSLSQFKFDYIKHDMNRYLGDIYSSINPQGEVYHKFVLGAYRFMHKIITDFPDIIYEGCASGGGRFDLGVLYFSPIIWTSDSTHPIMRMKIQDGTSYGYPLSVMSSHISNAEGEYLDKARIAFFGCYGSEMNPTKLKEDELNTILNVNKFYKKEHYDLITNGVFYRLSSPETTNITGWLSVSKDENKALLFFGKINDEENTVQTVRVPYLNGTYCDENGHLFSGKYLKEKGFNVSSLKKKGQTIFLFLKKTK